MQDEEDRRAREKEEHEAEAQETVKKSPSDFSCGSYDLFVGQDQTKDGDEKKEKVSISTKSQDLLDRDSADKLNVTHVTGAGRKVGRLMFAVLGKASSLLCFLVSV